MQVMFNIIFLAGDFVVMVTLAFVIPTKISFF